MSESNSADMAKEFAHMLARHHESMLRFGSQELKDALTVKMVALTSLAFDLPPTEDAPLDTADCVERLRRALQTIERAKQ